MKGLNTNTETFPNGKLHMKFWMDHRYLGCAEIVPGGLKTYWGRKVQSTEEAMALWLLERQIRVAKQEVKALEALLP